MARVEKDTLYLDTDADLEIFTAIYLQLTGVIDGQQGKTEIKFTNNINASMALESILTRSFVSSLV